MKEVILVFEEIMFIIIFFILFVRFLNIVVFGLDRFVWNCLFFIIKELFMNLICVVDFEFGLVLVSIVLEELEFVVFKGLICVLEV